MVHCLHCIFRGVLNTRILNVVNTIKVVIIKDLLITVSFTYKIDLSITATILCITEGCTKRNQPKSYYIHINCIVLYSIHCLTGSLLCHENDKYKEKENKDTEDLHHEPSVGSDRLEIPENTKFIMISLQKDSHTLISRCAPSRR